ncbi:MAG: DNA primase, partial [Solobacterium sp.]|nr:DNA primase [Solobacterium sp.]
MARIPEEEVAEVRRRADIADIIGRYLTVQKRGREYRAVCPFHDDHDPSLHINPDMQIYKCFVCGAGGNMFTFVQNYENVSFP